MAKAALNMLTRTSSEDLAKSHRIFMNSVDTGTWCKKGCSLLLLVPILLVCVKRLGKGQMMERILPFHSARFKIDSTGWINDENPLEKASKIAKTNLFQTPIDEIDAAARILDPVFVGVVMDEANNAREGVGAEDVRGSGETTPRTNEKKRKKAYGLFFKDYRETEW